MNNTVSLVLCVTEDCNLMCKYCYARAGERKTYMDINTFKKALKVIKTDNFKLQVAGGEPLMNFSLIEQIYDYLKRNNYNTLVHLL